VNNSCLKLDVTDRFPLGCKQTVRERGSSHPSKPEPEQLRGLSKPVFCKAGPNKEES